MAIKNSVKDIRNLSIDENAPDQFGYNCGGFALGTFDWYRPYSYEEDGYIFEFDEDEFGSWYDYNEWLLNVTVSHMLDTIDGLRLIENVSKLKENEYAIAYRVGAEIEDFHYMRRSDEGRWFEKQGWDSIHEVDENYVYADKWELTPWEFYDSDLILFAKVK